MLKKKKNYPGFASEVHTRSTNPVYQYIKIIKKIYFAFSGTGSNPTPLIHLKI